MQVPGPNTLVYSREVSVDDPAYLFAWLAYLAAALILCGLLWWLCHRLPAMVSAPLVLVGAVLVLMPWTVTTGSASLAPAWVVALFDGLVQQQAPFSRAGIPLAVATVMALAAGLGLACWWTRRRRTMQEEGEHND